MYIIRTKYTGLKSLLLATAVSTPLLAGTIVQAEEEAAAENGNVSVFEEIVVTSQKREQMIQDVGLAVTALSGDQMRALGMTQSVDVARITPGVYVSGSIGGQMSQFTIRGVTQNDFTDSVESPVAVYVDEGYIAMMQGQTFSTFDVDRVEVIKGPQSTLFGRNATGGVVHYITRKPTEETEGFVDLTYGRFNQVKAEAAIGGALSDKVLGRVSVFYSYNDAFLKNEFPDGAVNIGGPVPGGGQDLYNDDTLAGRAQLLFKINDEAELLISGFAADSNLSEAPYQNVATIAEVDAQGRVINSYYSDADEVREAIGPGGVNAEVDGSGVATLRPVPGGDFFGYIDPDGSGWRTSKDFAFSDINQFTTYGTTAKLTWDIGNMTLIAISDYKHFDKFATNDVDAGPADQFVYASGADEDTFTQEIRLEGDSDRFRWITGLYYLYIDNSTQNGFLVMPSSVMSPAFLGAGVGADLVNLIDLTTNSYSAFGQIEYDLTDTLTFTAGARVIREEKDYAFSQGLYANADNLAIDTNTLIVPLRSDYAESAGDTFWAGKVQLDWRPTDDLLVYAGINRGVKAGSFNAKLPDGSTPLSDDAIGYGEEILTSYEIGFKATFMDGKARLNGAAYYYDYEDYQASVFSNVSSVTENADAMIKGMELELFINPASGLDIMLSASYVDAEVENLEIAPGVFRDVKPAFTPDFQATGLIRYEFEPEVFGGHVSVQADATFVDEIYHNIRNFDSQKLDSYVITNVRADWTSVDMDWTVSAFVSNVFDESYATIGFDLANLCGCNEMLYGKPRWWGVSVRRDF
ncbi:TonB-dependent receptor [Emcibacter nanhaiensis]|nr:TonB-dependent receptor [Emcibacter nanhaiensis]